MTASGTIELVGRIQPERFLRNHAGEDTRRRVLLDRDWVTTPELHRLEQGRMRERIPTVKSCAPGSGDRVGARSEKAPVDFWQRRGVIAALAGLIGAVDGAVALELLSQTRPAR